MKRLLLTLCLLFATPAAATYNGQELQTWSNISATSAAFTLRGGLYGVTVIAGSWGTVTLQRLADDGSTYVTALTAFSANGYASAYLPSGTYKLTIASATGVYADVTSIITPQ